MPEEAASVEACAVPVSDSFWFPGESADSVLGALDKVDFSASGLVADAEPTVREASIRAV